MKCTLFSCHQFERSFLERELMDHEVNYVEESLSLETVEQTRGSRAIILFSSDQADSEVVQALAKMGVGYITTRSVGYDHIDINEAWEHGIPVANVPEYSPYSVSEHAVTLLMALNRNLLKSQEDFKSHNFSLSGLMGRDINKMTAGIVGCGKIGKNIARIMKGYGCHLLGYDIEPDHDCGITFCDLDDLLCSSDVVFLSCPLNKKTKHLIGKRELGFMKEDAFLINVARGGVIDTEALIDVLNNGHLAGVGLDVYEYEKGIYFKDLKESEINRPFFQDLKRFPNVLMTAHQGFLTLEAVSTIAKETAKNLDQWSEGRECDNQIMKGLFQDIIKRIDHMNV